MTTRNKKKKTFTKVSTVKLLTTTITAPTTSSSSSSSSPLSCLKKSIVAKDVKKYVDSSSTPQVLISLNDEKDSNSCDKDQIIKSNQNFIQV
jgi:hypothetical protein